MPTDTCPLNDLLQRLADSAPSVRVRRWAARLRTGEFASGTTGTSSPRPDFPTDEAPALAVVAPGDEGNAAAGEGGMKR